MRLRNSVPVELLLIAFVYVVGVGLVWRTQIALEVPSWHGTPLSGVWQPSLAGWWLRLVSLPIFQFLLLRWYFRLFVWARFLWQVSRIDLQVMPMHPDRSGGLSFLASVAQAFSPLLLAQGSLLAGMIANRIFTPARSCLNSSSISSGSWTLMVFAVLGPLLAFSPKLDAAKRTGLREHGGLAQRYVREYDRKWLRGGAPPDEALIGSADIQSLADLGNSFDVVKEMRWVPFTLSTVLQLAATTLLPVLPLTLTMISLEELLERLLKLIF